MNHPAAPNHAAPSSDTAQSSDAAFLADFHFVATIGATDNNGVDRQALTPLLSVAPMVATKWKSARKAASEDEGA